ncbi:MAG: YkgJ family cysteine cluster protein [Desulfobulbaceae bacterium]|nr:YkgJ family cysteine cluster protein [Desulfobulbaceae bacterium]
MFIPKLHPPKNEAEPELHFPPHVRKLQEDEKFTFSCHPGVTCFTECCRELELALTPYDVLRLRTALGISSQEFLDAYAIVECEKEDVFPNVYLGMVDDGRASCPFVSPKGCLVYAGRPAPCRTYPLGRGAWQDQQGDNHTFYVLLTESHCDGFSENTEQTIKLWIEDQRLGPYFEANDLLVPLLQHEKIKQGFRPNAMQQDLYISTLYNLENFKKNDGKQSDIEVLRSAVNFLITEFFG